MSIIDTSSIWGLGRGRAKQANKIPKRLSTIFAETVTGKHLRDVKFWLVGPQGSGKSRSLLYLAVECSKAIAARVGGSPEDYFPSDLSNVVVGDPQGHAELFQNIHKYNVIIIDDAGVSLNSRNFATSFNKSMNDTFQTMRPNRSIVLISAPDVITVDIVIRSLCSHYGEVAESYHGHGYNLVKVFRVNRRYREGKTHYVYNQNGNQLVVRYKFQNPSEEIIDRYETKRLEATNKIASQSGKSKEKPVQTYPSIICQHCGYEYTPRTDNTRKRCPQCFKSVVTAATTAK